MKTVETISLWPIDDIKTCIKLHGKQQAAEIFLTKLTCLVTVVDDVEDFLFKKYNTELRHCISELLK